MIPASRNAFFAADRWDYNIRIGPWRYRYWDQEPLPGLAWGLARAALIASVSARLGLWWGRGMARVQR